jgi:hypothetical protein
MRTSGIAGTLIAFIPLYRNSGSSFAAAFELQLSQPKAAALYALLFLVRMACLRTSRELLAHPFNFLSFSAIP